MSRVASVYPPASLIPLLYWWILSVASGLGLGSMQGGLDFGGGVGVIGVDRDPVRLTQQFEPPAGPAEFSQRRSRQSGGAPRSRQGLPREA